MAEESRDCSEITNVPGSSARKSSSSDPNFTVAEETPHLIRQIIDKISTSDSNIVNFNWGIQGDVITGVGRDVIKGNTIQVPRYEYQKISTSMEGYVGMESRLNKMLSYLDIGGPDDVRIIGICGMGGIGKTTIAEVVSEREKAKFEGYCFLEDVREVTEKQGVVHLQQKLLWNLLEINVNVQNTKMGKDIIKSSLCNKRVLIILDDVDQDEQLEALCHRAWFGPGSRIIITSRNEHLLSAVDRDEVYQVDPLTEAEAFQLFRMKAFKEGQGGKHFLELSKEFLKYADGVPLAIKVLGGSVKGRRIELWSSTLDRLKNNPKKKVTDILKVSFEGLENTEKKIFLDIACFFKGHDIDHVTRILQGDGHCPDIDIEVLREKSLVTLFGRKLWMHDLIQTMGWEIVLQQYPEKPGKRSRLWVPKDIIYVLDRSQATSAIESILLQGPTKGDVVHSINESFSNMDRLRLLNIWNVKFSGNIKYLSNELQYLKWHECPLDFFPSDFQPDNLVELHMHSSRIEQLWKGKKGWGMLRHIDMTGSLYLISTPDFTEVPLLEKLVLEACISLVEVHPSLGFLKKLICLNMTNCISVESMPPFTSLKALESLNLSLCSRLKKFPEIKGTMESLFELDLEGTSIEELPPSVERLTGLTTLNLTGCSKLDEIPENLNCVESLENLYIGETAIQDLSFLVGMKNLKSLSCKGCRGDAPRSLLSPASLSSLTSLIALDLSDCNLMDGDIPDDLSSLISLRKLHLSGNCFVRLPESFSQLSKLDTLYLRNCRQLELVPKKLPLSLGYVHVEGCTSLTDYPNQIKVLTSVESGVTTIISLDSSTVGDSKGFTTCFVPRNGGESELLLMRNKHTEEEERVRLSMPRPVYRKAIELLTLSDPIFSIDRDDEIPEWFSTTSTRTPISIPTGDKKWKGVASCALFSVDTTADAEFSNYLYQFTLETDAVSLTPHAIDWERDLSHLRSSSHLLLIFYFPSRKFPESGLNESTVVRARFETNNPFLVVHKCGIRLIYEQDAGWFSTKICPEVDTICLNEDEGDAVLEAGWRGQDQVNKYFKWEKFIPPLEQASTLVLRKNIESVLPRYLEALNHDCERYRFNLSGSPAWFKDLYAFIDTMPAGSWSSMRMEIPQNLHRSKKWMGFAIYTSLAEEAQHIIKLDDYNVYVNLQTGTGFRGRTYMVELEHVRPSSEEHHQLLVVYIPRALIPEALFTDTSTTAMRISFKIDSPRVKFQTCGLRIVYQEDLQGFVDTIIQCVQREDSLEFYDKLVVEDWVPLIQLQGGGFDGMSNPKERESRTRREKTFELLSQKYRNWDWSTPRPVSCKFNGAEISKWKWFMHFKQGNSAEIQLPPNLLDDANWLGIAVCAFNRVSHEHPNRSPGGNESYSTSPDSEYNGSLTCRLDSDVDFASFHELIFQTSYRNLKRRDVAYDMIWFLYVPRGSKRLNTSWRQCKLARVTFSSSMPRLAVQSCALGLVYKKDVELLVQTLTSCDLP